MTNIETVAREFIAYYAKGGGCSNCGGLPHASTCFVGRFEHALAAPAPVTPSPSREQLEILAREALTLAKTVTNTWGCVARSGRDHDAIARFHRRHMELSERLAALASPVGETPARCGCGWPRGECAVCKGSGETPAPEGT